MNSDILGGIVVRLLPSIVILILAFVAAADRRTRAQWTNLLYQTGSLRPEQRDDPKVQNGVRLPFFIVAFCFLIWPIRYYLHATSTVEISQAAYGTRGQSTTPTDPGAASANAASNSVDSNAAANVAPDSNAATSNTAATQGAETSQGAGTSQAGSTPPSAAPAPHSGPAFNPYGQRSTPPPL